MHISNDEIPRSPVPGCGEDRGMIHCLLFDDKVTASLCMLRKQELGERGEFSCSGCAFEGVR